MSDFQARLIVNIFYFVLLVPFAAAASFFAEPPRAKKPRGWQVTRIHRELEQARRQF